MPVSDPRDKFFYPTLTLMMDTFNMQRRSLSGPCLGTIDACMTPSWHASLVSLTIPLVMPGQAI